MELNKLFIFPRRKLSKLLNTPPSTIYYRIQKLEKKKELNVFRRGKKALIFQQKGNE